MFALRHIPKESKHRTKEGINVIYAIDCASSGLSNDLKCRIVTEQILISNVVLSQKRFLSQMLFCHRTDSYLKCVVTEQILISNVVLSQSRFLSQMLYCHRADSYLKCFVTEQTLGSKTLRALFSLLCN